MGASGFPALDAHLAVLELSVANLGTQMHLLIAKQRQERNQSLPINRLPIELLTNILHLHINNKSASPFRDLHNLLQVSVQWYNLVKRSSVLWSVVCPSDAAKLTTVLANSGASLLDIRCPPDYPNVPNLFLERVFVQSERWRSVKLESTATESVQSFVAQQAPRLSELQIVMQSFDQHGMVEIPNHILSRLRHLKLYRIALQWNPEVLSGLVSLDLTCLGSTGLISVSQLIGILRASSDIAELGIGSNVTRIDQSIPHDTAIVELPRLTSLQLISHPNPVHDILGCIRFPKCSDLTIRTDVVRTDEGPIHIPIFDTRTAHVTAAIQSMLAADAGVMVRLGKNSFSLKGESVSIGLSYSLQEFFAWLEGVLVTLRRSVYIDLFVETRPTCGPGDLPSKITSRVEQLTVHGALAGAWVDYLSRPILVGQAAHFPFPKLEAFTIEDSVISGHCLLRMVRHRSHGFGLDDYEEDSAVATDGGERKNLDAMSEGTDGTISPPNRDGVLDSARLLYERSLMLQAKLPFSIQILNILGKNEIKLADITRLESMVQALRWDDPRSQGRK
ncbi:hypothetical protein FRB93_013492 [Tulasnella sp. JGI-2019a]|nr:hypothetical protein FRB93_013492 [Tulasnella sp. JGI-2019a]